TGGGQEAQPRQAGDHHRHHDAFPGREIGQLPATGVGALKGALHHSERIEGGRENAETRNGRDRHADLVRAEEDEKLADEVTETAQSEGREAEDMRDAGSPWL